MESDDLARVILHELAPLGRLRRGRETVTGEVAGMSAVEVVEVALPNEQVMLARVHAVDGVDLGPRDVGFKEQLSLEGITETLQAVGAAVLLALDHVRPEQASVEFGLDLAVKSGRLTGLLVEGDAAATLRVTLKWTRREPATRAMD